MMPLIVALVVLLLIGVLALCRWTSPRSPLLLRWLRGKLWFIRVASWRAWVDAVRVTGWRFGIFRNHGIPRSRDYGRRWGGYLLGLEIGNRGGTRRNVRHEMRLDPCPRAPYSPGSSGCAVCQRSAPSIHESLASVLARQPTDAELSEYLRGMLDESRRRCEAAGLPVLAPDNKRGQSEASTAVAPANAHRECACKGPRDCPIGRGVAPAGPEQDVVTGRFSKPEAA